MLHEILHTLGIEHPDSPKNPTSEFARNREHTLMADDFSNSAGFTQHYKDIGETASAWEEVGVDSTGKQYGVSSTPMPWAIAGLQYLYGINKSTNKGNTIYTYSNTTPFYETIWDASSIDTIDLNNFKKDLTIDINSWQLSKLSFDVADERWSNKQHGNLGIAFEAVIENATGGSGNDSIIGNSANNTLKGNSGNNNSFGKGGIDVLIGGEGHDIFKLQQGNGHAIIEDFISGIDQIILERTAEIKTTNSNIGMEIYQKTISLLLSKTTKAHSINQE